MAKYVSYCYNEKAFFHARRKYVKLWHHFIFDLVNKDEILFEFINTHENPIDFLTKSVAKDKFEMFKQLLKITN